MSKIPPQYQYLLFSDDSPYRRYVQVKQPSEDKKPVPDQAASPRTMSHGSYGALLLHPKWKLKRLEILSRDMHQCIHCRSNKDLQVHHRQYHFIVSQQQFRLPWDYPDHLLITLCMACNSKGHSKYKVPTINI